METYGIASDEAYGLAASNVLAWLVFWAVKIVITTAAPIAPEIWRNVLFTAVPCVMSWFQRISSLRL